MTHRDRAWRRRMTRTIGHREEVLKEIGATLPLHATAPHQTDKPHRPGKLSPVQGMRLEGQLQNEAREVWRSDALIHIPPEEPKPSE